MNRDTARPAPFGEGFLTTLVPRLLFWLCWALAAALIVLVLLGPALDNGADQPQGWRRVVAVFARMPVMRRTAVAAALGLAVTACVFFRTPRVPRPPRPSTGPVIGA